ncbi:hypothetical protein JCM8097_001805 [Rhodosporidiobolus ruineniae]
MAHAPQPSFQRRSPQPLTSDYVLDVRQQPRQARMAGSGEKADRRPIDPPPIIRLRIRKPHARATPQAQLVDADLTTPTLTHTLFMFASLVPENSEEELYDSEGGKSKLVAGSVVSSLFHLKDQSCFVFPDLSVRTEGRWRFKMSLFELGEDGVHFCSSIMTDTFQVYSSKRFPGMGKSTELSKSFAQQGLKLRIRRPGSKANEDEEDELAPRVANGGRKASSSRRPATTAASSAAREFAAPASRRPSAPVPSSSKRPWSSHDHAGPGVLPSVLHPHPHVQQHPPHPHAYAPYPSRLSASASHHALAPIDGRRAVSYSSHGRQYTSPPTASPASFATPYSHQHPHASHSLAHSHSQPVLYPHHPLSQPYPHHPHSRPHTASAPPPPPPPHSSHSGGTSLAAHSLSSSAHPHSPPLTSPGSSFSRHLPPPHLPRHRTPSPPPILAPIRSLPPASAPGAAPAPPPASQAQQAQGYEAASALASLCDAAATVESHSPPSTAAAPVGGGAEVEMRDAPAMAEGEKQDGPSARRGSLAMLLGEGARDAKSEARKEGVEFF